MNATSLSPVLRESRVHVTLGLFSLSLHHHFCTRIPIINLYPNHNPYPIMEPPQASSLQPIQYRHLDTSQNEIRLLSFQSTSSYAPLQLSLSYVSLNDWKLEYLSFYDQNKPTSRSSELCEAWKERCDFTLATPKPDVYNTVARFNWGDYVCLSYAWGDCKEEKAIIFVDSIATSVSKRLEAALRDLQSSFECGLGMKVWVDALCINQADVVDRGAHVLRVKDIFGRAFAVAVWTKESDDLQVLGLSPPGERLLLCELVLIQYGRQVLEELLGVRERDWGVADDEDYQISELVEDVEVLVFDQYHWSDSDDEDDLGFGRLHLRDLVRVELWQMFKKEYWSRLWIIQELAFSSMTSTVYWGESEFRLSTLRAIADILLTHFESERASSSKIWEEIKPGLDLLAFSTLWDKLETASGDTEPSLDDTSIRELGLLAARASCLVPHDRIYALLGLFPSSVSSIVTIDYSREMAEVIDEFSSAVPQWIGLPIEEKQTVSAAGEHDTAEEVHGAASEKGEEPYGS
jgi:hypothetical protein